MTGDHVGAVLTAGLAIVVVGRFGRQEMFVLGALPALVLVPLMVVLLPESPSWLASQGRAAEARAVGEHYGVHVEHHTPGEEQEERSGGLMLLSAGRRRNSIAVWGASSMGLLLVHVFTAANHPPRVRATALGMSAGVGRLGAISGPIVGGTLLSAGRAYPWGFLAFAAVGALGGAAMTGTRTRHGLRGPGR
ncbi:hypothetical protein ACH9EU_17840 [Kocuria sp. M1R5S2]|uniref:hypothetical protein n=1 Tax=Kocuria rhizosphaerae TaxID=3376285 RepID=UPI00378D8889